MAEDDATWTVGRLVEWTRGFFEKKGINQPRLEAEILLAHVLGAERIDLYLGYARPVGDPQRERLRDLVRRRAAREPARYLTGECEFMSLAFKVTPACLIPRPETELLVEEVVRRCGRRPTLFEPPALTGGTGKQGDVPAGSPGGLRAIDLCTGCGCVAVSLAAHLPAMRVLATDISAAALDVARTNAQAHGVGDRIEFLEGDLYDALDAAGAEPADFLVANPPYVAEAEWAGLEPEVRDYEPRGALVAGPEGTEMIARILKGAPAYLRPGGTLLVEIGASQGTAARELAGRVRGLADVEVRKDYANLDRMLVARKA